MMFRLALLFFILTLSPSAWAQQDTCTVAGGNQYEGSDNITWPAGDYRGQYAGGKVIVRILSIKNGVVRAEHVLPEGIIEGSNRSPASCAVYTGIVSTAGDLLITRGSWTHTMKREVSAPRIIHHRGGNALLVHAPPPAGKQARAN